MKTVVQNSNESLMLISPDGKGGTYSEPIIAWSVELIGEESSAVIPVTVTGLWPDEDWAIYDISQSKWWTVDDSGHALDSLKEYFKKNEQLRGRPVMTEKDFNEKFSEFNRKGKSER